jgi:hypothetical protein
MGEALLTGATFLMLVFVAVESTRDSDAIQRTRCGRAFGGAAVAMLAASTS